MFHLKSTSQSWRGEFVCEFLLSPLSTVPYVQVILLIKQNISFTWISNWTILRNSSGGFAHQQYIYLEHVCMSHFGRIAMDCTSPFCTVTNNFQQYFIRFMRLFVLWFFFCFTMSDHVVCALNTAYCMFAFRKTLCTQHSTQTKWNGERERKKKCII